MPCLIFGVITYFISPFGLCRHKTKPATFTNWKGNKKGTVHSMAFKDCRVPLQSISPMFKLSTFNRNTHVYTNTQTCFFSIVYALSNVLFNIFYLYIVIALYDSFDYFFVVRLACIHVLFRCPFFIDCFFLCFILLFCFLNRLVLFYHYLVAKTVFKDRSTFFLFDKSCTAYCIPNVTVKTQV